MTVARQMFRGMTALGVIVDTYLLKAIFSNTATQTIADGQKLRSIAPMAAGLAKININDSTYIIPEVQNNELLMVSTGSSWNRANIVSQEFSRVSGRAYYAKVKLTNSSYGHIAVVNSDNPTSVDAFAASVASIMLRNTGSVWQGDYVSSVSDISTYSFNTEEEFLLVDNVTEFFVFQKIDGVWTIISIHGQSDTIIRFAFTTSVVSDFRVLNAKIPQSLFAEQITPVFYDDFSGVAGSIDATRVPINGAYRATALLELDGAGWVRTIEGQTAGSINYKLSSYREIHEFTFKRVGSVTSGNYITRSVIRRDDDLLDNVRVDVITQGLVQISESINNVPAIIGSGTRTGGTFAVNTEYLVRIIDGGDNKSIKVYIDDELVAQATPSVCNDLSADDFLYQYIVPYRLSATEYTAINYFKSYNIQQTFDLTGPMDFDLDPSIMYDEVFTDGQVLRDTVGEIDAGSFSMVNETGTGLEVLENALKLTGNGSWDVVGAFLTDLIPRQDGQAYYAQIDQDGTFTDVMVALQSQPSILLADRDVTYRFRGGGDLNVQDVTNGSANIDIGSYGVDDIIDVLLVTGTDHVFLFDKLSSENDYKLKYVFENSTVLNHALAVFTNGSGTGSSAKLTKAKIPQDLMLEQITPDFLDNFNGDADRYDNPNTAEPFTGSRVPNKGVYAYITSMALDGLGNCYRNPSDAFLNWGAIALNYYGIISGGYYKSSFTLVGGTPASWPIYGYIRFDANPVSGTNMIYWRLVQNGNIEVLQRTNGADSLLYTSNKGLQIGIEQTVEWYDDGINIRFIWNGEVIFSDSIDTTFWTTEVIYPWLGVYRTDLTNYTLIHDITHYRLTGKTFDLTGPMLLDADFSKVSEGTLIDGQVLDDQAEIEAGIIDATIVPNNELNISNGVLNYVMDGTGGVYAEAAIRSQTFPRVEGRLFYAKVNSGDGPDVGSPVFMLTDGGVDTPNRKIMCNVGFDGTVIIWTYVPTTTRVATVGIIPQNTDIEFIIILHDTIGFSAFVRGAQFTEWTFAGVDLVNDVSEFTPVCQLFDGSVPTTNFQHSLIVPDKTYVEQITPLFEDLFDGTAGNFDNTRIPNIGSYVLTLNAYLDGAGYAYSNTNASYMVLYANDDIEGNSYSRLKLAWIGTLNGVYLFHRFRYSATGFLELFHNAGSFQIRQVDNTVPTVLSTYTFSPTLGLDYVFEVYDYGDLIKVLLDGTEILTANSTAHLDVSGPSAAQLNLRRIDGSNYLKISEYTRRKATGYTFQGIDNL